jgi:hypothetical protein
VLLSRARSGESQLAKEEQPMSITHNDLSPESKLAANLQIAIGHIEAALWTMKGITT